MGTSKQRPVHWADLDEVRNLIEAGDGHLPRCERVVTDAKDEETGLAAVDHTPTPDHHKPRRPPQRTAR